MAATSHYTKDVTPFQPLIDEGYNFDMNAYIKRGWEIFKKNPGEFIAFTLVYTLISASAQGIATFIPIIGPLAAAALSAALAVGFPIVAYKISHDQKFEFGNFFDGFQDFVQLGLGTIVFSIFVAIGMFLLLIPGIYLAVGYMFVSMFIVFCNLEFWPAMETSRKVISKNWFSFFGLVLVLILINIAGLLALVVGLFVTIPLSSIIVYVAFEDIVLSKTDRGTFEDKIDEIGVEDVTSEFFDDKG